MLLIHRTLAAQMNCPQLCKFLVQICLHSAYHRSQSTSKVHFYRPNPKTCSISALTIKLKSLFCCLIAFLSAASGESKERSNNEGIDSLETMPEAVPVALSEPPIEEQLAWHTLWPESHKLYGHGNELFSICSDHDGKLVASSCKALLLSNPSCINSLTYFWLTLPFIYS